MCNVDGMAILIDGSIKRCFQINNSNGRNRNDKFKKYDQSEEQYKTGAETEPKLLKVSAGGQGETNEPKGKGKRMKFYMIGESNEVEIEIKDGAVKAL